MTLRELIEVLEDRASTHGDETEVTVRGAYEIAVRFNPSVQTVVIEDEEE